MVEYCWFQYFNRNRLLITSRCRYDKIFSSFFITSYGPEYGVAKGCLILSVHSHTRVAVFSSLGKKDFRVVRSSPSESFCISFAIFKSSLVRLRYSWSIIYFESCNLVPVTTRAGEKPCSFGIFLIPSNMIGNAFIQFCFLVMIAVFRVQCSFSII